jgi:hypothetical protein
MRVSRGKDKKDGQYGGLRCRERKGRSARASARQLHLASLFHHRLIIHLLPPRTILAPKHNNIQPALTAPTARSPTTLLNYTHPALPPFIVFPPQPLTRLHRNAVAVEQRPTPAVLEMTSRSDPAERSGTLLFDTEGGGALYPGNFKRAAFSIWSHVKWVAPLS